MAKINHPDKTQGHKRSGKWPTLRKKFLLANPTCAVCGGKDKLEVHHKFPYHLDKTRELNEDNLIVLCETAPHFCHINYGHLGSYKSFNPDVVVDAKIWNEKIKN